MLRSVLRVLGEFKRLFAQLAKPTVMAIQKPHLESRIKGSELRAVDLLESDPRRFRSRDVFQDCFLDRSGNERVRLQTTSDSAVLLQLLKSHLAE